MYIRKNFIFWFKEKSSSLIILSYFKSETVLGSIILNGFLYRLNAEIILQNIIRFFAGI